MSTDEKKEFVCNICDRNDFKHNMALKAHERWHNSEYRSNISKKLKAKHSDPDSKYNSPEYKEKKRALWRDPEYRENISKKIKALRQDPNSNYNKKKIENQPNEIQVNQPKEVVKSNKPNEVVKFTNPQIKLYFEKYLKIHMYFDQKTIVKDYIRSEFNGRRINPNIQLNIEQSFDLLIQNNLEIGKIENYTQMIYRSKRG